MNSAKGRFGKLEYCRACQAVRARAAYERRRDGNLLPQIDWTSSVQTCWTCKEEKPLSDYPRNKNRKNGYHGNCKPCHSAQARASRDLQGGARRYHLRRRYGIELADYDAMYAEQNGCCAICELPQDQLHVDHDHETGEVRGLLCFNCNGGLGQFKDSTALLNKALTYMECHYFRDTA